jgi:predicted branched-subunit amino acid permease
LSVRQNVWVRKSANNHNARQAAQAALPIVAGYVVLGIPCGVLGVAAGMNLIQIALMSLLFYSGAGQYMIPNMWIAGAPVASIVLSVSLINTRQVLYAASLSRYLAHASKRLATLFAATLTDESFGVNLAKFGEGAGDKATANGGLCEQPQGASAKSDVCATVGASCARPGVGDDATSVGLTARPSPGRPKVAPTKEPQGAHTKGNVCATVGTSWTVQQATLVNLCSLTSWIISNCIGALLGSLLSVPVALASFAMTSIFICLLFMQKLSTPTVVAAVFAVAGVGVCKLIGLTDPAILIGALVGIAAGLVVDLAQSRRQIAASMSDGDKQ